jgi:hypothetical protein
MEGGEMKKMRIVLSNKQFTMLRLLESRRVISEEEASTYLQPTYSSMVRRGYLVYDDGKFERTPKAIEAIKSFENAELYRKSNLGNLSDWLEKYVRRQSRVQVMKKGAA